MSDLTLSGTQFAGILMCLKTVDIISNQENTILIGASNKQYEGYSALANFYSSDYYSLAFGTATIYMNKKNRIVGFYDSYNFDSKPKNTRSKINEFETRAVRIVSPKSAKPYSIKYGYQNK